jgi:hypothetical protein
MRAHVTLLSLALVVPAAAEPGPTPREVHVDHHGGLRPAAAAAALRPPADDRDGANRCPHLQWSADGCRLLAGWTSPKGLVDGSSTAARLDVWDVGAANAVWRAPVPAVPAAVQLDRAGNTVRACLPDDTLRVWTLGRPAAAATVALRPPPRGGRMLVADFFPDGRLVAVHVTERDLTADLYAPAGKHLGRHVRPHRDLLPSFTVWSQYAALRDHPGNLLGPRLRPVGVVADRSQPPLQDPKVDFTLGSGTATPSIPAGSALIALRFEPPSLGNGSEPGGGVWDAPTGRYLSGLPWDLFFGSDPTISPDGRWLADATDSSILVRELASVLGQDGRVRRPTPGGRHVFKAPSARSLAFSPDGKRLASAHTDGTIYVWDVPPAVAAPWAPADADRLWADLGVADAAPAWKALWHLLDHPAEATEWVGGRLKPVPAHADTADQIARLDDGRYAVRERAAAVLAARGEAIEGDLRAAIRDPRSEEQHRRLEGLLGKFDPAAPPDGETLRALRAVWLLERLGTPEAKKLLERLAGGAAGSRVTREAKAALERMP